MANVAGSSRFDVPLLSCRGFRAARWSGTRLEHIAIWHRNSCGPDTPLQSRPAAHDQADVERAGLADQRVEAETHPSAQRRAGERESSNAFRAVASRALLLRVAWPTKKSTAGREPNPNRVWRSGMMSFDGSARLGSRPLQWLGCFLARSGSRFASPARSCLPAQAQFRRSLAR